MCLHGNLIITMAAISAAILPATGFSACDARNGPKTAALVEIYISEGCSSCPPADRQLSHLRQALDPAAEVVPLALHVAVTESGLVSKAMRGENSGATLAHDHVVRTWIGPIRLADAAAFVQDERSGSVLQALLAGVAWVPEIGFEALP